MKNAGNIFIGIVVAAAAGVILGMLITPEKGKDLRKSIKDTAGDWTKKIGHLLADGSEKFKGAKDSIVDGVSDLKIKAKNAKA